MLVSKLKSRAAQYLHDRTMSLIYGIQNCSPDYSEVEFQDDLFHIELLSSGRKCIHHLPEHLRLERLPLF